jgi:hypothetical protein
VFRLFHSRPPAQAVLTKITKTSTKDTKSAQRIFARDQWHALLDWIRAQVTAAVISIFLTVLSVPLGFPVVDRLGLG